MRFRLLCVALGAVFLIVSGFRPGTLPYIPQAGFSDATISHFPAALFLRQSVLDRGQFPLWRDTLLGGQPFAANPLNKTAYPLQWLALIFPPDVHLDLMALLHLLLAGWGMWRWTRALGLREEAAAVSALAYALAPRVIAHLGAGHLDVVYALAWFPWLMGAVHEAIAAPGRRSITLLRLALFAALVLWSDVRVSLFAFTLAAAYGLTEAVRLGQLRARLWLVGALIPFLLLTVSVLLPFLGWQSSLTRGDLTPSSASLDSMQPYQWSGLLGLPVQAGNHEELAYVGLPVLLLALIAVAAEPRRHGFFLAALALAALYALGSNGFLWSALVRLIPPLVWFRVPSRAWLVIALIAPLLAGYGVQAVLSWAETRLAPAARRRRQLVLFVLLGVSLACAGTFLAAPIPGAAKTVTGLTFFIGGSVFALILLMAASGRLQGQTLALALLIITFADLGWSGLSWLTWRGADYWLTPYADLGARLASEQPARIYAPIYYGPTNVELSLPQEVAAVYGLRLFGGIDPFQMRAPVSAIIAASGMTHSGYDVTLPYLAAPAQGRSAAAPDTRLLAGWDVSHVVSAFPIESPRLQSLGKADNIYLYRNLDFTAPPQAGVPAWPPDASPSLDPATVERLNRLTLISAGVSGVSFAVVVFVLALAALRSRRALRSRNLKVLAS